MSNCWKEPWVFGIVGGQQAGTHDRLCMSRCSGMIGTRLTDWLASIRGRSLGAGHRDGRHDCCAVCRMRLDGRPASLAHSSPALPTATLPNLRAFGNISELLMTLSKAHKRISRLHQLETFYMLIGKRSGQYICAHCRCRQFAPLIGGNGRGFSQSRCLPQQSKAAIRHDDETDKAEEAAEMRQELGRMTERLAQMTEESLEQGTLGARTAVKEAGFSGQLKQQLEERLQQSQFKSEHAAAYAEINMPVRFLYHILPLH